jgi:hypothetical protein
VGCVPRPRAVLAHPRQDSDPHRAIEELEPGRVGQNIERAVAKREGSGARRPDPAWQAGDVDVGDEAVAGLDPVAARIGGGGAALD